MCPRMASTNSTRTMIVTIPATPSRTRPVIPAVRFTVRAGMGSSTDAGGPSTSGLPAPGFNSSSAFGSSPGVVIFLLDPREHPVETAARHGGLAVPAFSHLIDLERRAAVGADLVEDAPTRRLRANRPLKGPVLGELCGLSASEDHPAGLLVDLVVGG